MLHVRTVTSTATAASLESLLGLDSKYRNVAAIRMDLASGTVTWGDRSTQPFTVAAAGDILPVASLKDVWLVGAGDVDVAVFYHP